MRKSIYSLRHFKWLDSDELKAASTLSISGHQEPFLPMFLQAAKDCPNVEFLNLSDLGADSLDPIIGKFAKLQVLNLTGCKIKSLPDSIGDLQNLEKLYLQQTSITTLPKSLKKLDKLKLLALNDTPLKTIPPIVFELGSLEELYINETGIKLLPKEIARLTKLKKLDIFRTQISTLPKALLLLSVLEELRMNGCPIETLPDWIGGLKKLRILNTDELRFEKIPYFLFKLKKLAYYCIPDFEVEGVKQELVYQLRSYLKKHTSEGCAQALVHLQTTENEAPAISPKYFVELTNTRDELIYNKVLKFLKKHSSSSLENSPIQAGSEVAFLGKFGGLGLNYVKTELESKQIVCSSKVSKTTSHVVLCLENKKKFDPKKYPEVVILSNSDMVDWMKKNEGAGYLDSSSEEDNESMQESISALLLSNSLDNISTALEMLQSGGIPKAIILPLLLAYSALGNRNSDQKKMRADIREILCKSSLSKEAKDRIRSGISKSGFSFHPNQDNNERRYIKRLERKGHKDFDMTGMALYYYKTTGKGYLYLLESKQVAKEDKVAFMKENFLIGNTLKFSGLSELVKVPEIVAYFKNIERVDLQNCAFGMFPALLRDGVFPKLREIDLRNNPISKLPKNVSKKLLGCAILIGKLPSE